MEATKENEYVTDADLRAWTYPTRDSENRTHTPKAKPLDNPKPPRKKPERVKVEAKEKAPKPKRMNAALEYKKTVDQCAAVVRALEVVTVKLGYNLTDQSDLEARKHRRAGWHTFCRVIQLTCKDFTMRGIDNALSVPNKPCREVLTNMFEACRHECPHSEVELMLLIS